MSGQQQHGWLAICGPLNRKGDVPTIRCLPLPFMEKRADRAVSVDLTLPLMCRGACTKLQSLSESQPQETQGFAVARKAVFRAFPFFDEEYRSKKAMLESVASRPTLPVFGSRSSRELRVAAIRCGLFSQCDDIDSASIFAQATPPIRTERSLSCSLFFRPCIWQREPRMTTRFKRFLLRPQLLFGDQALNKLRSILLIRLDPLV